jgi:hypothetical protein
MATISTTCSVRVFGLRAKPFLVDWQSMPEVVTSPAEVRPDVDEVVEPAEPSHAHIVKVEPGESAAAKILEARIYGTPVEALCGHVWVPSRDPKQLPVCQECASIYEMYKAFNGDLPDTPSD